MTYNDVRSQSCPSTHPRAGRFALAATLSVALAGTGALGIAPASALAPTVGSGPAALPAALPAAEASAPLTNLSHLNFLLDEVPLPVIPGHSTYQAAENPVVEAPWTYADKNDDGSYTPIGGGDLDPATGYYTQGAFNADDTARAAVVYLRHWQQTGDTTSRDHAFQTLRSLTYLQTTEGPNAGNVVLWQQVDGTLNPSAEPVELPDPSDSAESYWLARTVWALGEAYPAFRRADPAFNELRLHLLSLLGVVDDDDHVPVAPQPSVLDATS